MSDESLSIRDILTERCLCGVCKGYLSIPPIVYSRTLKIHVCGRCFDEKMYEADVFERREDFERTASTQLFPCSNYECDAKVEFGEHAKFHEEICIFAEIKCPVSNFHRGFLKPTETPCYFRCRDEEILVDHIRDNHSDYILPSPQMIRPFDLLMDTESRRMFFLIFLNECRYRLAVVTIQKNTETLEIRCRTLMEDPEYCILDMDPPTNDKIQCFECIPFERPRYKLEQDDEVYKIRLSRLRKVRTIGFRIHEVETALVGEDEEFLIDAIGSLSLMKTTNKRISSGS